MACLWLLAGCASPPTVVRPGDRVFSLGTYQEGNNLTEPRPRESTCLRTRMGGFEIVQGFAAFKLYLDVLKPPAQRVYTRAIVPNPQDADEPFVYEHYLDPHTRDTAITHGPVAGLRMYEDYVVEFILYADEARTEEIDRLAQPIRCYVDTTGPELKFYEGMKPKVPD